MPLQPASIRLPAVYKSVPGKVMKVGTQSLSPARAALADILEVLPSRIEARMIALVRCYLDPTFSASSPLAEHAVPRKEPAFASLMQSLLIWTRLGSAE